MRLMKGEREKSTPGRILELPKGSNNNCVVCGSGLKIKPIESGFLVTINLFRGMSNQLFHTLNIREAKNISTSTLIYGMLTVLIGKTDTSLSACTPLC